MSFAQYTDVNDIKQSGYSKWRSILLRMNYSGMDYQYHQIKLNYQTFRYTIWRSINSWTIIILMISTLFALIDNNFFVTLIDMELITNTKRLDLLAIESIFLCILNEYMWFYFFCSVLNYRSSLDNLLCNKKRSYSERRLSKYNRQYLCHYFTISNRIFMSLIHSISCTIIISIFVATYLSFNYYLNDDISFSKFILFIPIYLIGSSHTNFLVKLFIGIGNYLLFYTKFLELRFLQLKRMMNIIVRGRNVELKTSKLKLPNHYWYHFQIGYVRCYEELKKFNQTTRTLFLFGEIINKSATIFVCSFYSKQQQMNMFNSSCVFVSILIFILMNIVYYRLATLPGYNHYCCHRLILPWLARIQTFNVRRSRTRFWLKTNFFLQTMTANHFGFTCGQFFIITKFKHIELILLNLPWIMLFYKKICLA